MSAETLNCWRCGAAIQDQPLPLSRTAECSACRAELHVCRMCTYYDTTRANACREPVAEPVTDKSRANFCGWFRPQAGLVPADGSATDEARQKLEDLFR